MLEQNYIEVFKEFVKEKPEDFIRFEESGVEFMELKFAEAIPEIKDRLYQLAIENNISQDIIFIPRTKIKEGFWDNIINIKVADLIRQIYDLAENDEFATMRQFKILDRGSPISRWLYTKFGKNFLYEYQISEGIRAETLVRKRLYLFNNEFVRQQMMWMSESIWIHKVVVEAFNKWSVDKSLWKNINHVKRQIQEKILFDESRHEIKFLRKLENEGLKNRFIHDVSISWQLKFRPDFWFINDNLIVEFDEKAHKSREKEDKIREKVIKKHLPNITFIRVKEGYEDEGLIEILNFLKQNQ